MKKVKEWLISTKPAQFEVHKSFGGIQHHVSRIKDNKFFHLDFSYHSANLEEGEIYIQRFHEDLIHVDYEIIVFPDVECIYGTCEINDIVIVNESNKLGPSLYVNTKI